MSSPSSEDQVPVDPQAVINRLREELSGWILRCLVAEEAVAVLNGEKAANIEQKKKSAMSAAPGVSKEESG